MKYDLLTEILDSIRKEAPESYKKYRPEENEVEKLNQARCKAYIHLFLKVKFKLNNFNDREKYITDKSQDGGLDAYYIDQKNKKIYLIQSKFRTTESTFENKDIEIDELLKMEYDRITRGEKVDCHGNKYNDKIINFQKELKDIENISRYEYRIVVLANLKKYIDYHVEKVIGNYTYEVFNYEKTYNQLIYPICTSNYNNDISIYMDIRQKKISILSETFNLDIGNCKISVVFLPVREIAKTMNCYKNSLLKYNPRNYISISKSNVNKKIEKSIIKNESQEFAILNNGITIICDKFNYMENTGSANKVQIGIDNPQIINGAQTSYTLSKIYDSKQDRNKLNNKKVMVRFIEVNLDNNFNKDSMEYKSFIQKISDATNTQNKVDESDKKSNRPDQEKYQKYIYEKFGYLYERKVGEFDALLSNSNINKGNIKHLIIDRSDLIRAKLAFDGKSRFAMHTKGDKLFTDSNLDHVFLDDSKYDEVFLAYMIYNYILEKESYCKLNKESELKFRYGVTYGKFVMINAASIIYNKNFKDKELGNYEEMIKVVEQVMGLVLDKWNKFEIHASRKNKDLDIKDKNKMYNYYKRSDSENDAKEFFSKIVLMKLYT